MVTGTYAAAGATTLNPYLTAAGFAADVGIAALSRGEGGGSGGGSAPVSSSLGTQTAQGIIFGKSNSDDQNPMLLAVALLGIGLIVAVGRKRTR